MSRTFKLSIIFLVTVVMLMVFRIVSAYLDLPSNIHSWLFSFFFQVLVLGLTPFLMYTFMFNSKPKEYIELVKIKTKINPLTYVLAVLIGLMVFYLNTVISSFNYIFLSAFGFTYTSGAGTIFSSPEVLVFEIITTAILPGIFEEIADRGLLLGILRDVKSDRLKMLIVGITFGLLHQNVTQFASTFFAGIILGYLAIHTGSIIPSMIVHFMNNFLIVMLDYSGQHSGGFDRLYSSIYSFSFSNIIYLFVMVAAVWTMLYMLMKQVKRINMLNKLKLELPSDSQDSSKTPSDFDAVYEIMKVASSSQEDDFNYIYSLERQEESYDRKDFDAQLSGLNKSAIEDMRLLNVLLKTQPKEQQEASLKESDSFPFKDYALFFLSLSLAAVTTIFTFIWGVIR